MNIEQFFSGLDQLFAESRMNEVEGYLMDALQKAESEKDSNAELAIINEIMGFYRVTNEFEKALHFCERAIKLSEALGLQGTIPYATTLQNTANANRAAGNLTEALEYFKRAEAIYQNNLAPNDFLFASINNNLSLLYQEMGDFASSVECLRKALVIAETYENAASEIATTYGNLGMSLLRVGELEEAKKCLQTSLTKYQEIGEQGYHYSATLSALGEACFRERNYKEALTYYEEAASELERLFGKNETYQMMQDNIRMVQRKMDEENNKK